MPYMLACTGAENVDPYSTILQSKESRHRYVLGATHYDLFCVCASDIVSRTCDDLKVNSSVTNHYT